MSQDAAVAGAGRGSDAHVDGYRELFERSPAPTWVYDAETLRVLDVNAAALARYGYSIEEFLGLTASDLHQPTDAAAAPAARGDVASADDPRGVEHHRGRNGLLLEMDVVESDVTFAGRPARMVVARDVSTERPMARALRASELWFRTMFELAAVGMACSDRAGRLLRVNRHLCTMLGYSEQELLGLTFQQVTHPDDLARNIESRDRFLADEVPSYRTEQRFLRKDGTVVWAELTVTAMKMADEERDPLIRVAHLVDVTERRRTEDALRESEAEFRAVLGAITDVVLVLDADGRYVEIPATSPSGRYRPPELLVGRTLRDVFPAADAERFEHAVRRALATGDRTPLEYSLHVAGETRWFTGSASPLPGTRLVLWVVRDVTAERAALAALEQREAELRQAQKLEAVGQLAGGMAHDFNNLLTVIRAYAELILIDVAQGDPVVHDLAEIVNAAARGAALTRQLLAFSRKQVLQPRLLDVNDVIRGASALFRTAAGPRVMVVTDLMSEPAVVRADPGQLEQVILNLVVNARDAMPDGGRLAITTRRVLAADPRRGPVGCPADCIELSVADTGTGMTEEVRSHVFEPFFTTRDVGGGTGLGLATVYGIVKQSGGGIAVESAPGAGTRFLVWLPRSNDPMLPAEPARASAPSSYAGSETVLLVDDDPAVRASVRRMLERAGYVVLESSDGASALRTWSRVGGAIDIVVTDLAMPGMGGGGLARELHDRQPGLPVIAISGYVRDDDAGATGLAWATAVIEKPFTRDALVLAVRAALDARHPAPSFGVARALQ